jgi:quercetin dioxygenase-like cupin family protein
MLHACPSPDRVIRLLLGGGLGTAKSTRLLSTGAVELVRLVVPAGRQIPTHRAAGEITVQCLEGRVAFEHEGAVHELLPGDLMHLCPQESHAVTGIEDSSLLVTLVRPHPGELPERLATP